MSTLDAIGDLLANGEPSEPTPPPPVTDAKRGRGRPPRPGTPPKAEQPKPKVKAEIPMPPAGQLADAMTRLYAFAGMGLMPLRPNTAKTVMGQAEDCGKAWEEIARTNPAVRRALLSLLQTSTVGALIAAHVPIALSLVAETREIRASRDAGAESAPIGPEGAMGDVSAPISLADRRARRNRGNNGFGQNGTPPQPDTTP